MAEGCSEISALEMSIYIILCNKFVSEAEPRRRLMIFNFAEILITYTKLYNYDITVKRVHYELGSHTIIIHGEIKWSL